MNRLSTVLPRHARRIVTVLIAVLLGLAGAVAVASPARADQAEVSGSCEWDSAASEWVVTWMLSSLAQAEATAYRVLEATASPDGSTVAGITATAADTGYPHDANQPLTGTQRLPEAATSAGLTVMVEWDSGETSEAQGTLGIPTDCATPAAPVELGQWTLDCDALTITIDNSTGEDVTLRFVPSAGDSVDVGVAGGESAAVAFPPSPGLSVDIQHQGRSIVDPDQPIEITAAQWAELTCEEDGDGGGLPATGRPIGLIAGGSAALLALGAGLFLIARRRRIIFTA